MVNPKSGVYLPVYLGDIAHGVGLESNSSAENQGDQVLIEKSELGVYQSQLQIGGSLGMMSITPKECI